MSIALDSADSSTRTVDVAPDRTALARHRAAWRDLRDTVGLARLCWMLSWLDIKLRYRGSVLGPFWLTLSTAVMVGAMGTIYGALFHMDVQEYLPFLAFSLVLWNFLGAIVGDGCQSYTQAEAMIRSARMPYTLYAARVVIRNLLILAHNLVVIVAVFALMAVEPGLTALWALPALVLWLIDCLAASMLLGAVCARFRDIPPIVGSVMQMAFFVTPIIWRPELAGPTRQWLLPFNPFFSLIEIVRAPLMYGVPSLMVYVSAVGYSLVLCLVTWLLFARVRGRIAFWV